MKTKINVSEIAEMTIKDYQSKIKNEFRRLEAAGETTNVVVLSEFVFKCESVGALLIVGDFSGELEKFYKEKKKERSKEKDFGVGDCKFEPNPKGNVLRINLTEGAVSPSRVEKGMKKSKLKVAAIISKGEEIAKVESEEPAETAPKTEPANSEKNTDGNLLSEAMDKIKTAFQTVREILVRAANNSLSPDEQKTVLNLQQQMQSWLKLYNNSSPELQQANKEQALKLKEQLVKILSLMSKNDPSASHKLNVAPGQLMSTVGRNAENLHEDVMLVQEALNRFKARLNANGVCDEKTIAAIEAMERAKFGKSDGIIEPNSKIWKWISTL